jgi:hypothetical protein
MIYDIIKEVKIPVLNPNINPKDYVGKAKKDWDLENMYSEMIQKKEFKKIWLHPKDRINIILQYHEYYKHACFTTCC